MDRTLEEMKTVNVFALKHCFCIGTKYRVALYLTRWRGGCIQTQICFAHLVLYDLNCGGSALPVAGIENDFSVDLLDLGQPHSVNTME